MNIADIDSGTNTSNTLVGTTTEKKVRWRLLPFLALLYFIAYLDRLNIGYASIAMNKDLEITSQQFGLLAGIFFIGYFLFEVPSNIFMKKFGARVWIARILVSWGIVSTLTAFAQNVTHLYILRFILGLMEAGFFPGIIFFMTGWFRKEERAKAVSLFMIAVPFTTIFGAPISGLILDHIHWAGIQSWRWLFVLEGLPAVILGCVTFFILPNKPRDAKWLNNEEKSWLEGELEREQQETSKKHKFSMMQALTSGIIWALAFITFSKTLTVYGLGFFTPQIIKSFSEGLTNFEIGLINAIPYVIATVIMIWWSKRSDKKAERRYHVAIPLFVSAIALCIFGYTSNPILAIILLSIINGASYAIYGPFWALPSLFLTGTSAAVGIAAINSIASLGGFVGPYVLGAVKDATGSVYVGLYIIAAVIVIAGIITLSLKVIKQDTQN